MKSTTLKKLRDHQSFTLTTRKLAVTYRLHRLDKKTKKASFTSISTNRSFQVDWNKKCFI